MSNVRVCRVMRSRLVSLLLMAAFVALASAMSVRVAVAASEPVADPWLDPGACFAAAMGSNAEAVVGKCGPVIDNKKISKVDRVRALMARADVYARTGRDDRAVADYSAAVTLDPARADAFNRRGEIYRSKSDRPHALADFAAALKIDPQHSSAKGNYKALARELEWIGAQMPLKNKTRRP